ncbi:MAG: WYL domain-containing protein [Clostridia bacterium]|nr:WYL domain-containing protein [Clostridia bacterium]
MDSMQPKKLIIMNILAVLRKYSDENHRMSQKEIAKKLESDHGMKVDRKAVKRNLMNLMTYGLEIECSETTRMVKNPHTGEMEESSILTDFYIVRDFTDAELRLLIDSLLFSKHIPYSQCKELIEKIEGLSNKYFLSKVKHICNLPENLPQNKELFYTIEMLDEAISEGRQVSFKYNRYGTDKKLHPRQSSNGEDRIYIVNPYQMVATNGRYYLVCNYDKYDNIANYRVDMITDIKVLDSPVKPKKQVRGLEAGLDLPKHMAEHIYMFSDETVRVRFIAKKYIVGEIIDWFGKDVKFSNETEDEVTAEVRVSAMAMKFWALQYAPHITVTEPKTLREEIGTELRKAAERYGKLGE